MEWVGKKAHGPPLREIKREIKYSLLDIADAAAIKNLHLNFVQLAGKDLSCFKEEGDFSFSGLWRVGAMDGILVDGFSKARADRSGGRFFGVGGSHELSIFGNGVFSFQDHDEDGAGRHVGDKLFKEETMHVHGIKSLGLLFG